MQAVLDDPATAGRMLSNPHIGEVPLDQAIDRFYTSDVFMHTWDLARATGQDDRLDPALCADLLAGMEPIEELHPAVRPVRPEVRGAGRRRRPDQDARLHRPRPGVDPDRVHDVSSVGPLGASGDLRQ